MVFSDILCVIIDFIEVVNCVDVVVMGVFLYGFCGVFVELSKEL